jgi:hypothetical protein
VIIDWMAKKIVDYEIIQKIQAGAFRELCEIFIGNEGWSIAQTHHEMERKSQGCRIYA